MISDESESLISTWIKRHNVTVPVAQGKVSSVARLFGARGYPSSYVLNPNGAVVWQGHPMQADDALLESMLTGPAATATGATPPAETGNWWVWMLALFAVAFVAALGWFWWSTRDRIPAYLKPPGAGYQPPPGYAPTPQGPPGAAPSGQAKGGVSAAPVQQPAAQPGGGYLQPGGQGVPLPPAPETEDNVPDLNMITGGGNTRALNQRTAPFQASHENAPDVTRQFNTTRARGKGQHYMGDPPPQG